jgi:C1A family cysteine protease
MPVVTAFPVYRSWYEDGWVESTGEIGNPLPSDLANPKNLFGYHAICLTGYDENDREFYFKNSWGPYWAKNSTYSPGYGKLPYDYFNNHALESYYVSI